MDIDQLNAEAERQFTLCNACRYCEGLCSVFPAMELRTAFTTGDINYLANLCHDCRACADACPFSPPHEMAIDIPILMSTIRARSFAENARPRFLWDMLTRPRALATVVGLGAALIILLAVSVDDPERLVREPAGRGAFYDIVAYTWLVVPGTILGLLALGAIAMGVREFVKAGGVPLRRFASPGAHWAAATDVLGLTNLRGGGAGCHVDGEEPSGARRRLHHLVFYGFAAMFLATVAAAVQQDVLGVDPPFGLLSIPVILGTLGGIATAAGCVGFMVVARKERQGKSTTSARLDRIFGVMLLATTASGLLVLILRSTVALGPVLLVHLALVGGFFLCLPYSKFVHGAYRYLALVQFHIETRSPTIMVPDTLGARGRREPVLSDPSNLTEPA